MFFTAALAAAWAVMSGRRGWWPALVVTASIAAQAHLMFTVPSGVLAVLALIVGLVDTIRAQIALLVGADRPCSPALRAGVPRLSSSSPPGMGTWGNRSAAAAATTGTRTGGAFSLKALSAAMGPPPLWWKSQISAQRSST